MATYVLVHGACCGGADWLEVQDRLVRRGHKVLAPDLPGMGADRTPLAEVSLESWSHFIADLVCRENENSILVGHSRGGIVISQAAEFSAHRIQTLVYVAAMLVPDGASQGEISAKLPREINFIEASSDGSTLTVKAAQAKQSVFNTTPDHIAARALAMFGPEPAGSFSWPLHLTQGNYGRVPRIYIETAFDNAIPLALQKMMREALPCERTYTLMTDHFPEHSAPDELSGLLHSISQFERSG